MRVWELKVIQPKKENDMSSKDWRSEEAAAYRKLYKTKQWRHLREEIIVRDMGLCRKCGVALKLGPNGKTAAIVHHKKPHKGNLELFYKPSNLISVCKECHDGPIQSEEKLGFSTEIGDDGWPVDENHYANRKGK